MAAGEGEKKNLGVSSGSSPNGALTNLESGPSTEEEIENLTHILDQLEERIDTLDNQASSLTDRIKEFLQESRTSSENEQRN